MAVDAVDGHVPGTSGPIRVLVVDDSPLVRQVLVERLSDEHDVTVVGACEDGSEVVDAAARLHPDIVCMDLSMSRMDGLAATEALRADRPGSRVVVLTAEPDAARPRAAAVGANAVVPKTARADGLLDCLRAVASGADGCPYCL
jgi:DNA-binding NarL/FixJ family response regulator